VRMVWRPDGGLRLGGKSDTQNPVCILGVEVSDMPRPGRKGYSKTLKGTVLREVAAGAPVARVAKAYGLSRDTIHEWLRATKTPGKKPSKPNTPPRPLPRVLVLSDPLARTSGVGVTTEDGEPVGLLVWAAGVPHSELDALTKAIYSDSRVVERLTTLSDAGNQATTEQWEDARRSVLWLASQWQERRAEENAD